MEFEINFNRKNDDKFLINKLGAYYLKNEDYPGLFIKIKDFEHLKELLEKVDKHFNSYYSAIISWDPPTIYLDENT